MHIIFFKIAAAAAVCLRCRPGYSKKNIFLTKLTHIENNQRILDPKKANFFHLKFIDLFEKNLQFEIFMRFCMIISHFG